MLNLPLTVTPFLAALVFMLGLVAERWLRQQGASAARYAIIAIMSSFCTWSAVVMSYGAYATYMAMPPDLPARSTR